MESNPNGSLTDALLERGISRREFLKFCALMAGTLALPASAIPESPMPWRRSSVPPSSGWSSRTAPAAPNPSSEPTSRRLPSWSSTSSL